MPVRKFRSVEEMNRPVGRSPGSPELFRAMREVWDFGRLTSRVHFKPGVYRFRSIEEMQESADLILKRDEPRR